ncbi:shikimate dehydrogenase family protein [Stygiolobus caldivivus]|uniref:Shikimate dehydrogenase (NADP(+)) n=1 Tax=Stygiolobus caldivivus TaxID=2824673 RepID=A0A8D5ZH83_9CREN|nr:shikimate dehydrogenase [Stygiolobus caldivivus]BCU69464.1 shikimate 5-dehydrogenase [Stygiolobus caldivivus]
MLEIDYHTRLLGVLGENIAYTLSPAIHNYVFQKLSINAVYLAFDIKRDKFTITFPGLLNITYGLNVTIPYKEEVIKYVKPEGEAKLVGAVNTIFEGRGYNTDYLALHMLVKEKISEKEARTCTVFGAGGASRAAIYSLLNMGCEVYVINRSRERAEKLKEEVIQKGFSLHVVDSCPKSDIVVNTTPDPNFVPDSCIHGKLVVDFVYKPVKTPLIIKAEKKGISTINGIEILVEQALEADKIWFGKRLERGEVVKYLYAREFIR